MTKRGWITKAELFKILDKLPANPTKEDTHQAIRDVIGVERAVALHEDTQRRFNEWDKKHSR